MPESDEVLPATVTYKMTYRLVGPAYPEGRYPDRQRVLTVFRDGHVWEARTDEEAAASIREFVSRPLIDAAFEVVRVTKVTTTRRYENVTHLGRCPTCDSALADPKSGWSVAAPECSDPWHGGVVMESSGA